MSFVGVCADHTRRLQLLDMEFWAGKVDIRIYRKRSRELLQRFVDELRAIGIGIDNVDCTEYVQSSIIKAREVGH